MSGKMLIPFAIRDADQKVVSVEEVESGLRCQCHCPSCKGILIARKGEQKTHHFSHHKSSESECAYAFETSVRLMLLDKLNMVVSLNTPAMRLTQGKHNRPVTAQKNVMVNYVPSSGVTAGPTALYQVGKDTKYQLGIYLPPAGTSVKASPSWLQDYSRNHGCTGVLSVDYGAFSELMFKDEKPGSLDPTFRT
ncbi:competence protein CoiA family protein [Oceanisphaera sp.]|uniref:competence protein CoiA family protein n=1 Tax=Oceanisphaera sp. TaxID=1929979 RepID=UPI003A956790